MNNKKSVATRAGDPAMGWSRRPENRRGWAGRRGDLTPRRWQTTPFLFLQVHTPHVPPAPHAFSAHFSIHRARCPPFAEFSTPAQSWSILLSALV